MAREKNTGMIYNEDTTQLLDVGSAPLLLEPVQVNVSMKNVHHKLLYVLDHSGNRTGKSLPLKNGKFYIDGNIYKTMYYELSSD
jgi:hypothetical protein